MPQAWQLLPLCDTLCPVRQETGDGKSIADLVMHLELNVLQLLPLTPVNAGQYSSCRIIVRILIDRAVCKTVGLLLCRNMTDFLPCESLLRLTPCSLQFSSCVAGIHGSTKERGMTPGHRFLFPNHRRDALQIRVYWGPVTSCCRHHSRNPPPGLGVKFGQ